MKENIVFLNKYNLDFPNPINAPKNKPIAIGGDLKPERLVLAYKKGIFPWYSQTYPILWWSPDPRFVLFTKEIHISKSLKKELNKNTFDLTVDLSFEEVIRNCSSAKRKDQQGTWITEQMIDAYLNLFNLGYAHSIESRIDGKLVGGFYGVNIGSIFFGESMFHLVNNASKVAFAKFVIKLIEKTNIDLIDCQIFTEYLASFGARYIPREEYLKLLEERINISSNISSWKTLHLGS